MAAFCFDTFLVASNWKSHPHTQSNSYTFTLSHRRHRTPPTAPLVLFPEVSMETSKPLLFRSAVRFVLSSSVPSPVTVISLTWVFLMHCHFVTPWFTEALSSNTKPSDTQVGFIEAEKEKSDHDSSDLQAKITSIACYGRPQHDVHTEEWCNRKTFRNTPVFQCSLWKKESMRLTSANVKRPLRTSSSRGTPHGVPPLKRSLELVQKHLMLAEVFPITLSIDSRLCCHKRSLHAA